MTPATCVVPLMASAGLLAFSALAHADPIAGKQPPRSGSYTTDWGPATLSIEQAFVGRANANATFRFQDGTLIWGYFLERPAGRPVAYEFIGRYMLMPRPGGLPAALGPTSPCSEPLRNLPTSIDLPPERRYWGSLRIVWAGSGNAFRGRVNPCSTVHPPEVGAAAQFSGSLARITEAVRQEAAQVLSLPRDGPCASIRAAEVAETQPCEIRLGQPLRMRLLRDLLKGDARVIFTPLDSNHEAVNEAMRLNRPLPRNARLNTAYQVVRDERFWRTGDTADVIAPGATCANPQWELSLSMRRHHAHRPGRGLYRVRHRPQEQGSEADRRAAQAHVRQLTLGIHDDR